MKAAALAALLLALIAPTAHGYCNSATPDGTGKKWGPRTSSAFPPGWNGLAATPYRGWRSWYAYYTKMDQADIVDVIDALTKKNRTVKGWDGKVSLCDLGYCTAGIDEGWEGCGLGTALCPRRCAAPSRSGGLPGAPFPWRAQGGRAALPHGEPALLLGA